MIDFIGLIITGLSTLFLSSKNPWENYIWKTKITRGLIGMIMLIGGLVLSGILIIQSNNEKIEYKKQLIRIQDLSEITLFSTLNGTEEILLNYEAKTEVLLKNLSNNYNELINTIISQSDSALNNQIVKIKEDYNRVKKDFETQKEISHRYYFSEEWPFSDKKLNISGHMFFFIPIDISGQVDGIDRYIVWTLIKNKGFYPYNKIDSLHDEIWNYLKPMKLSLGLNLERLKNFNVIKPDYWKSNNIEFTDEFMERLKVYQTYKDTEEYVPKLFEVYKKYRMK